jgi:hypothetical protein
LRTLCKENMKGGNAQMTCFGRDLPTDNDRQNDAEHERQKVNSRTGCTAAPHCLVEDWDIIREEEKREAREDAVGENGPTRVQS